VASLGTVNSSDTAPFTILERLDLPPQVTTWSTTLRGAGVTLKGKQQGLKDYLRITQGIHSRVHVRDCLGILM